MRSFGRDLYFFGGGNVSWLKPWLCKTAVFFQVCTKLSLTAQNCTAKHCNMLHSIEISKYLTGTALQAISFSGPGGGLALLAHLSSAHRVFRPEKTFLALSDGQVLHSKTFLHISHHVLRTSHSPPWPCLVQSSALRLHLLLRLFQHLLLLLHLRLPSKIRNHQEG